VLSYRHAFHAGNHADVLKHLVLVECLRHLLQKPVPLCYIETHAGIGRYLLDPQPPAGKAEWLDGIARLWTVEDLPAGLAPYVDAVRALNPNGRLRHYPGSPWLAADQLRADDRAWLFELLGKDFRVLQRNFQGRSQLRCSEADGFAALCGLLPPQSRRGLVLIDPSYEVMDDYRRVVETLRDGMKRFASGCYLVWYPIVHRPEAQQLPEQLLELGLPRWLRAELQVRKPPAEGYGLHGSGMFVVNPPWTLPATLAPALTWLAQRLALDDGAGWRLDYEMP